MGAKEAALIWPQTCPKSENRALHIPGSILVLPSSTTPRARRAATWGLRASSNPTSNRNSRRSNQSILKEINPEYSLEGLMLKLKLQYFGHLMPRTDSLEKTLMLGKTEGKRRRWGSGPGGRQRIGWLDGIINSMGMNLSKLQDIGEDRSLACCRPWGCKESDTT